MRKKFEQRVVLGAVLIAAVPIIIFYAIFLQDKLKAIDSQIKTNLYSEAFNISKNPFVQEKLGKGENDLTIQKYVMQFVNNVQDIDLIVVCDMAGKKYAHLDEKQIGEVFIGEDKKEVLEKGTGYYSITVGSMGKTIRRFEPIFYKGRQVGFVMVGKYYKSMQLVTYQTELLYFLLFVLTICVTFLFSKKFAKTIKKAMLNMEPEEIAKLYMEKKAIINSIIDGIIALNSNNEVVELNKNCEKLFEQFSRKKILEKLKPYIEEKKSFDMKEMIILKKKIFVSFNPIFEKENYLGAVITFIDENEIRKIAKEITGVDEVVKDLRATAHEFKNKLHVILGLIKIKEYEQAEKYILETREAQESKISKFSSIDDCHLRAMLISREIIAKERNINFILTKDSTLFQNHGYISSKDLITIIGNLIENAFEACSMVNESKEVTISLFENDKKIIIEVTDNGMPIPENIKDDIFKLEVSSKGEDRGTGLYIVKNRVELYDGSIEIEEEEKSKTFRVTLFKGDK